MKSISIIPPEQAAYEIPEIWDNNWFGSEDGTRIKEFNKRIPNDAISILDVGCGNGLFLNYISASKSKKGRICGVDRSKAALSHVKTEKYSANVDALPFNDNEFDIVTSLEVIEHLPVGIYEKSLEEMTRVARQYILIGVPFNQDLRNSLIECPICTCRFNADYHLRSFSENTIKNLFIDHNFECKEVFFVQPREVMRTCFNSIHVFLRALKRIYKNQDQRGYPGYAVCPACGYSDTSRLVNVLKSRAENKGKRGQDLQKVSTFKKTIKPFFLKQSYRWIGALYESTS